MTDVELWSYSDHLITHKTNHFDKTFPPQPVWLVFTFYFCPSPNLQQFNGHQTSFIGYENDWYISTTRFFLSCKALSMCWVEMPKVAHGFVQISTGGSAPHLSPGTQCVWQNQWKCYQVCEIKRDRQRSISNQVKVIYTSAIHLSSHVRGPHPLFPHAVKTTPLASAGFHINDSLLTLWREAEN